MGFAPLATGANERNAALLLQSDRSRTQSLLVPGRRGAHLRRQHGDCPRDGCDFSPAARPFGAARLVRDEETTWKARPDWSPDGSRVAYSSYLGRQWHQLWMTTAAPGGYPIPFSYGEFDVTGARWSPDGARLAYVSNESGDGVIVVQDVVGGARRILNPQELDYREQWRSSRFQ
ncbi:MAG: hypothetical protein HC850_14085 [Rhodomicrobium sp.]|nr:hypothetical protein [Rhodomicrobium sp.]